MIMKKGSTSKSVLLRALDSLASSGVGLSIAYNTSGLTAWYQRQGAAEESITLATLAAADTAWSSGGLIQLNASTGDFRLDVPDAALVTGADWVNIRVYGAANLIPLSLRIDLVNYDPADGVRMGLTALPNAAADAAGGLPISDAGGLDMDARLDAAVSTRATPTNITAGTITTVTNLTNLPSIPNNWITAAGIADGALTAAKFASGAFDAVWSVATRTLTSVSALGLATAEKLLAYVQLIVRKDAAIATDNAAELTAINADGGSGGGAFANTTDSGEAIRDRGDAAWITATSVAVSDKTGFSLASTGLDLVLIDTKTLPAAMQIIAAACAGIIVDAGTATETFKGLDKTTTRITATVDASGNRSAITYG